jgi:hypothetical protein
MSYARSEPEPEPEPEPFGSRPAAPAPSGFLILPLLFHPALTIPG